MGWGNKLMDAHQEALSIHRLSRTSMPAACASAIRPGSVSPVMRSAGAAQWAARNASMASNPLAPSRSRKSTSSAATSQAGFSKPELLGKVASVAVWGFAIVVAVNQLGIAATLVNTLFMGLVGGIALAAGLAFGLGGRDTAAEIVRNWYRAGKQAEPKVEVAAQEAEGIAREEPQSRPQGRKGCHRDRPTRREPEPRSGSGVPLGCQARAIG